MKSKTLFSSIACVSFVSITSFATADKISPDIPNAAFAPMTILEAHPQCDGPGAVAFRVDFERANLRSQLGVDDDTTGTGRGMSDGIIVSDPICTRTERKGTEVYRIPVACDDTRARTTSPSAFLAPDELTLSLMGSFTACQSPISFDVIESDWTATVVQKDETTKYSDSFITRPKAGCDATEIHTDPSATLSYSIPGTSGVFADWTGDYRFLNDDRSMRQPPVFFRITLRNIPVQSSTQTESRFVSEAWAIFFPTYDGQSTCLDGLCELPMGTLSTRFGDQTIRTCR